MLYVSGQVPIAGGKLVAGGIKEQTEQVFANLRDVLRRGPVVLPVPRVRAVRLVPEVQVRSRVPLPVPVVPVGQVRCRGRAPTVVPVRSTRARLRNNSGSRRS